jgi:hypothetical protein
MSLQSSISTHLRNESDITDIVGQNVYPLAAPGTATFPFIVFRKTSTDKEQTFNIESHVVKDTYEFECWAEAARTAESATDVLRNLLDGFKGTLGTSGNTTTLRSSRVTGMDEGVAITDDGSDIHTYFQGVTVTFWYTESTPTFTS